MIDFKGWLISEAALGPRDVRYDDQGRPNFRIYILNGGVNVGLELLKVANYKYEGDMVSDVFGDSCLTATRYSIGTRICRIWPHVLRDMYGDGHEQGRLPGFYDASPLK